MKKRKLLCQGYMHVVKLLDDHMVQILGGNMIAATQVFGARAGKYAAKNEYENILQVKDRKAGFRLSEVLLKIQKVMWDNVLVSQNEKGLKGCIRELQQIWEKEVPNLFKDNGRLLAIFEIRNLLQMGQIIANAALIRKESRGSPYRSDFPYSDNYLYLKSIILKKEKQRLHFKMNVGGVSK